MNAAAARAPVGDKARTVARAWAVQRRDGLVLGFTDHDAPLEFEGILFRPDTGLSARAVVQGTGLSVDNSEAVGVLSDDAISQTDVLSGRWDEAELRLWEVDWLDVTQRRLTFAGHLGEITRQGAAFGAELRGLTEALNQPQGRVFHQLCPARLGDRKCTVDLMRPGLFYRGPILSGDGAEIEMGDMPGFEPRWFERGGLEVLTGPAEGLAAQVKQDTILDAGRRITLWQELAISLQPGDLVRLVAGCDKRHQTCRLKFDNLANFRGFPNLPPEDWLMTPGAKA